MASTRKASIGAEIRADRSKFKADLAQAKVDARSFGTDVSNTFRTAGAAAFNLPSDTTLAAKLASWKGQMLRAGEEVAAMASQVRSKTMERVFGSGLGVRATGLRVRPEVEMRADMRAADFRRQTLERVAGAPMRVETTGMSLRQQPMPDITRSTLASTKQWTHLMHSAAGAQDRLSERQRRAIAQTKNQSTGLLELGHAMQDAQYGLRGVINNIPGIVEGMGGSAKLAGAAILAAVGVDMAISQREKFRSEWGEETPEERTARLQNRAEQMASGDASKMREAMEMAGRQAAMVEEQTRKEDDIRARSQRLFEQSERRFQLENELAASQIEGRDNAERMERELALAARQVMQEHERRAQQLQQAAATEIALMTQEEQEIVQAQQARKELAKKRKTVQTGIGSDGQGVFQDLADANTEREIAVLDKEIEARQARLRTLQTRLSGTREEIASLDQQRGPEAELQRKLDAARVQARRREEKNEALRKAMNEAGNSAGEVAEGLSNLFQRVIEDSKKLRDGGTLRSDTTRQLEIDTLRAGGNGRKADKLQSTLTFDQNVRNYKEMGFTEEQSQKMAGITQQNEERTMPGGRRGIKGAVSKNRKTGIGGEFHSGSFDFDAFQKDSGSFDFGQKKMPLNKKLEETNKALAGAKAGPETTALRELKDSLLAKLDELIAAGRGTAGERVQPGAKN